MEKPLNNQEGFRRLRQVAQLRKLFLKLSRFKPTRPTAPAEIATESREGYGRCECGGKVVERRIKYLRRFRGQFFEFENVPVGVCLECGERIFKGVVLERLEELSNHRKTFVKKRLIPVGIYTL